jgi:hypothetical protein
MSDEVFSQLDDPALISRRADLRDQLEELPPSSPDHAELAALYDRSTEEINNRASTAWTRAERTNQ